MRSACFRHIFVILTICFALSCAQTTQTDQTASSALAAPVNVGVSTAPPSEATPAVAQAQPAPAQPPQPPAPVQPPASAPEMKPAPEQQQQAELDKKKKALEDERSLLAAQYQLEMQRSANALAKMDLEKRNIETAGALTKAKQDQELAAIRSEIERLKTESELAATRRAKEQEALRVQLEELNSKNMLLGAKLAEAKNSIEAAKTQRDTEILAIRGAMDLMETKRVAKNKVDKEMVYKKDPLENGVLEITDRRIPLNGLIWDGSADPVIERIEFFNNQSTEYPIFIVIDNSPGGSVMAGERILRAMKASKAPIYVVVKSFAASMAACITTLAQHSYIYPNALILHHQISSGVQGNLTQQKEHVAITEETAHRMMGPITEKIGTSEKRFVEEMYKNNSDGNWMVFGDKAKKLKWVDDVVKDVRELSVMDIAEKAPAPAPQGGFEMKEERDSEGKPFIRLPRLLPCDVWFIYNPDNYYRN
jgi:ATP-dependent Clp protease, protease subunit